MIIGIGTDIIEIGRIEKAIESSSFLYKCFTASEIELYRKRGMNASVLAGNFAAKESVAKAFGTGFAGFSPIDIEVLRDNSGKPYINLYGKAAEIKKSLNIKNIYLSISNCKTYAIAYVVTE